MGRLRQLCLLCREPITPMTAQVRNQKLVDAMHYASKGGKMKPVYLWNAVAKACATYESYCSQECAVRSGKLPAIPKTRP